jgi:hypothetical protein
MLYGLTQCGNALSVLQHEHLQQSRRLLVKVSVDLDLTPEELRRLFGLPDLTPIQTLVVERITRQVEKGMDSNLIAGITRSIITGGVQSWEAYQKLLTGIMSAGKTGDSKKDAPNPSGDQTD